jgi:transposase
MEVLYPHCAAADVHKKTVVATVSHLPATATKQQKITRTFGTFTEDLLALYAWLLAEGVTIFAMEATGSYWKPVYNVLEGGFTTWVVNPAQVKALSGNKTDVKDSRRIVDYLQYGLLSPSFIPDRPQRELRELVRYRKSAVEERSREIARVQKVLEGANIKIASVLSDVNGTSGRAMIAALVNGETDAKRLAELADPRVRASAETLAKALTGLITDNQRKLLGMQMDHIAYLDRQIAVLDEEIKAQTSPFEESRKLLETIPGVKGHVIDVILSEIGPDVHPFRNGAALSSWAGLAPGNNVSAGKRHSGKTKPGDHLLRLTLVQAAWAASRANGTYLQAQFRRLSYRLGKKKAALAVAHSIARIIWVVLSNRAPYVDLGGNYFDNLDREAVTRRAVNRLKAQGYEVTLCKTDKTDKIA